MEPAPAAGAPGGGPRDVTGLLDAAAAALAPRELVSDAGFSLLGAMSSLQVGDVKMDLGLRPARTAADRIRAGKAPLRLRLAQCLDVCDRLLRRYATWLAGYTLAQTVFDCLYLHHPPGLEPGDACAAPLLGTVVEAFHLICAKTCALVNMGGVMQEEDLSGHTFGLPLKDCTPEAVARFRAHLARATGWLDAGLAEAGLLEPAGGDGGGGRLDAAGVAAGGGIRMAGHERMGLLPPPGADGGVGAEEDRRVVAAVRHRLLFLGAFLETLAAVSPGGSTRAKLEACRTGAARAAGHLDGVRGTAGWGEPTAGEEYDAGVVANALPPTPPRAVKLLEAAEVHELLGTILANVQALPRAENLASLEWPWPGLLHELFRSVAHYAARLPGSLEVSILHLLLLAPDGVLGNASMPDLVADSLEHFGAPGLAEEGGEARLLLRKLADTFRKVFRLLCHNRGRQRRMWVHLVEGFPPVFAEAAKVTGKRPEPLLWLEYWALTCMHEHLLLGCELELYSDLELRMVYWYCEYLLSKKIECVNHVQFLRKAEDGPQGGFVRVMEAEQLFCTGVIYVVTALLESGWLKPGAIELNTERERFNLRFGAFFMVSYPPPRYYDSYLHAVRAYAGQADPVGVARACFTTVQDVLKAVPRGRGAGWAWERVAALQKASLGNLVALKLLSAQGVQGSRRLKCTFRFEAGSFAVLKLHS